MGERRALDGSTTLMHPRGLTCQSARMIQLLALLRTEKIHLANIQAIVAKDVVSGGHVKIHIG